MIEEVCSYMFLTDEEFRKKYDSLVEEVLDQLEDYVAVNLSNFGKLVLDHWAMHAEVRDKYPDLLNDVLSEHDLSSDKVVELILNANQQGGNGGNQGVPPQMERGGIDPSNFG